MQARLPDPADPRPSASASSTLPIATRHAQAYALHQDLLRTAPRRIRAFEISAATRLDAGGLSAEAFVVRYFGRRARTVC